MSVPSLDNRLLERLRSVAHPIEFLTNLFAHAPVGLSVWRPDGRVLLTNRAFAELFGAEVPPDYNIFEDNLAEAQGIVPLIRRAFAGEVVAVPPFWYDPRELDAVRVERGRRVCIELTFFPLFDDAGKVQYVAATYKDETAIALKAEHLRLSEERQRLAQQAARIGTFDLDLATGVILWSRELEAMHGLAPGSYGQRRRSWEELVHPDDREAAFALVERAIDTLAPVDGEWRVVWPDGSVHWLAGRLQALASPVTPRKAARLLGVNFDITERKKVEQVRELLGRASTEFTQEAELGSLLQKVALRVHELVGGACSVRLLTPDDRAFDGNLTATYHADPAIMARAQALATSRPLRIHDGPMGRVVASGEPLLVPLLDLERLLPELPPEYHDLVREAGIRTLLVVPLRARGKILGCISLLRTDPRHPYTTSDCELAQDLADRAATAIDSAILVRDLEERVHARTAALEEANAKLRKFHEELESTVAARTRELADANRALQASETRFRRLTESGIIGITRATQSGAILDANDAFLGIVGYTREEFAHGLVSSQSVNSERRASTDAKAMASLAEGGIALPWETELVRKDGSRVPVLVGAAHLGDGSDELIAFILDLSERRRAEAALRESEARKTAVMEAALDAIVVMDAEGRILEFNPAAERTFGYAKREVIGRPLSEVVVPPGARVAHAAGLRRYVETGQERILGKRIELPAIKKSGEEFPAEVAVVRIRGEGAPVFTGYIRDITERQRAAEAEILRREKEAAQSANEELEAFSYSVAHDLRAPLRGICGFSSAILEDHGATLPDDAKRSLDRIITAGNRMNQIIEALLSLARLSRAELRRETVDLSQLAFTVVDQLRATDPARKVEVVLERNVSAEGDPALLRAVLDNLLGNAWKFTRNQPNPRIEFGSLPSEGNTYFVRDNGAGFAPEQASRLFVPFRRLHSAQEFEGTGIGLATVQRIVQRHGGRVWAEGQVAAGATFHFSL